MSVCGCCGCCCSGGSEANAKPWVACVTGFAGLASSAVCGAQARASIRSWAVLTGRPSRRCCGILRNGHWVCWCRRPMGVRGQGPNRSAWWLTRRGEDHAVSLSWPGWACYSDAPCGEAWLCASMHPWHCLERCAAMHPLSLDWPQPTCIWLACCWATASSTTTREPGARPAASRCYWRFPQRRQRLRHSVSASKRFFIPPLHAGSLQSCHQRGYAFFNRPNWSN